MRIGYARVSTENQHLDLQTSALKKVGCDEIFTDHGVSGASFTRTGLSAVIEALASGDEFVVWRLDRLGRSLTQLVKLIDTLGQRNIQFRSLTEHIDTRSAGGMLMFHMMAALAQFERSLIRERTIAGMAEASARGKTIGRRPLLDSEQREQARTLLRAHSFEEVAQTYGVHPRTLKRLLNLESQHPPPE